MAAMILAASWLSAIKLWQATIIKLSLDKLDPRGLTHRSRKPSGFASDIPYAATPSMVYRRQS